MKRNVVEYAAACLTCQKVKIYGRLGVKVWVYKGERFPKAKKAQVKTEGGK